MTRKIIIEIITILFILLWIYASISKLIDYKHFRFQLGRSPYIQSIAGFIVWALPTGELLIGISLLFKRTCLVGMYASFFLMVLFTGYIYAMLHYSYFVPCSCGGILSKMSWHTHFVFNIFFTLLALTGILFKEKSVLPNHLSTH